jgi:pimeloyl-ACP methyl ester carboxylesterase
MLESLVRRFLYHPTVLPEDAPLPRWAAGAREVWLDSDDGERLHALHWPAPEGRPTVLFLHGNAQSVYEWALVSEDLAALEAGLLLVDYPGYGKSSGSPTEAGLYAAGRAALGWLVGPGQVDEGDLVVFGKSLGGGVATSLVEGRDDLGGLVLESTFRSVPSVAARLLPMIPAGAVMRSERYESEARMTRVRVPVLVVHGTEDDLIPVVEGRALYEAASPPKDLYLVEGAGHNDVSMVAGGDYGERLRRWLESL